jgi:short-subunit dehydrogenase
VRRAGGARAEGARRCDFLVNNAGRSIRRGVINSFDRFHDFERTMQLNYFGALRLIMGFLPKMIEKKRGHIINISSIGVLSNAPRFSAYVASKSALDSFSACAASEFLDKGIHFTTINMPLVRTPMIAPTKIYESVPTLSPERRPTSSSQAIVHRPVRIAHALGVFGAVSHAIAPKLTQVLLNTRVQHVPRLSAAQGKKGGAAAAHGRADGVRADHAGDSLVRLRPTAIARVQRNRRGGRGRRAAQSVPRASTPRTSAALARSRPARCDRCRRPRCSRARRAARLSAARPSSRATTTADTSAPLGRVPGAD